MPCDLARVPWTSGLRAVLRFWGLALAANRADAAIQEDRCLVPHIRGWLRQEVIADFRVALHHAAGLPTRIRDLAKPRAASVRMLADADGGARLQATVSRRMGSLSGEAFLPLQVEAVGRSREVFSSAPFAVALASLKVVCNGMSTSRRFGAGAQICRFRCRAPGGDDARHYVFPVMVDAFPPCRMAEADLGT